MKEITEIPKIEIKTEYPKLKSNNNINWNDNSSYNDNGKYKPKEVTIREFNSEKECYEYKTKTINEELEWQNQLEFLKEMEQLQNKGETIK